MTTQKKKKNTTIDDLATMVARGFDGQDKKLTNEFSKIDKRFEKQERWIEQRFDKQDQWIETRLAIQEDRFNEKFSGLDEKYDRIINIRDKMTKSIDIVVQEYAAVKVQIARHEEWIKKIAEKVGVQLDY